MFFFFLHGAAAYAMECRQCHASTLRLPPHLLGSGGYLGQLHMLWNAGNVMLRHCGFHPTFWVLGDIWGGCICYGMQAMSCFDIAASTPLLGFWGFCGAAAYAMECRQCHASTLRLPPHIVISWWIGGGLKWDISGKICFLCLL